MNTNEIRAVILDVLHHIAPDADLSALEPKQSLRDQLDLDSMDMQRLMVGLKERLKVEIKERDFLRLDALESYVAYLAGVQG